MDENKIKVIGWSIVTMVIIVAVVIGALHSLERRYPDMPVALSPYEREMLLIEREKLAQLMLIADKDCYEKLDLQYDVIMEKGSTLVLPEEIKLPEEEK